MTKIKSNDWRNLPIEDWNTATYTAYTVKITIKEDDKMVSRIELGEGKYTVVNELNEGGGIRALRYGEEWRDLTGDGMVLALCLEIERLQKKLNESEALLSEAHDVMDDVHLYDTDLYYEIILYFNGGDAE